LVAGGLRIGAGEQSTLAIDYPGDVPVPNSRQTGKTPNEGVSFGVGRAYFAVRVSFVLV
jgi:hypothetical protein